MGIDVLLENVKKDAISKFDATKSAEEAFEALGLIYRLCKIAREDGLLELEVETYRIAGDMYEDIEPGIRFLIDGTQPELLAELLTNEYWRDKRQGNDALVKYIQIRGILLMQLGTNPYVLQDILLALLPHQLHTAYKEYFDNHRADWDIEDEAALKARYANWNERKLDKEDINEIVKEVENKFILLDSRCVQRVLRDTKDEDLVLVMAAFSEGGRNKIFKNVSERYKTMLMEEIMRVSTGSEQYIFDAAKRIADIISHLEYTGEIDLPNMKV